MDVFKMIADLKADRAVVEEAIAALERISGKRGNPTKGRRSLETRMKMAEAQRKRWAAFRKKKKKNSKAT